MRDFSGMEKHVENLGSESQAGKPTRLYSMLRVAFIVVIIAIITAICMVSTRSTDSFTEFYLLGPGGIADGYPVDVKAGESVGVKFGVVNREQIETSYKVKVSAGGKDLSETGWKTLAPDDEWQEVIGFILPEAGPAQQVYFKLYREDSDEPSQVLYLWMKAH